MQEPPRQPPGPALSNNALLNQQSGRAPAELQQVPAADPLTAATLQQLEQQGGPGQNQVAPPQQPAATASHEQAASAHGVLPQPAHQRSPLGPAVSSIKRDSISSSSSSALLGRMSGASLQRPDFVASAAQQQQARQYMEQQLLQQQAQAQAAAAAAGVSVQLPPHMPAGGSATSSPPLSPKRQGRHGSARPSADGSGSYAVASMQPVYPQALGLPAIATTPPVPIPGTSPPASAGMSPRGHYSPRPSSRGFSITPQASLVAAAALQNAASMAILAAQAAQQQQQMQAPASVGGAMDTDDGLESSSEDDDDYEFGEQKIKRTFTRQQRRQKREQQLLVQQQAAAAAAAQQQAALLQQQQFQAQVQLMQQQQQAAELHAQLQQQLADEAGGLSPTATQGDSSSVAAAEAAAGPAPAAAGTSPETALPLLDIVPGASPPGTPTDIAGTVLGSAHASTSDAAAAAATAALQQQVPEQQALLAMLASQQQQQQGVLSPGTAAGIAHAAALEGLLSQVPPSVDWASAVPQAAATAAAAAAAAAAGATAGSAGGAAEPSFVPVLEQTLSGTSAISAASGRSKRALVASPVLGSTGGAPAAAWLKGMGGTSGGAEITGSVGSARHLNVFGSSADAPQASGASFMTRQQPQGGCPAGVDAAGLAAGVAAAVAAGMGGSGGGAAAAAGAGGDGVKKDQAELKAEFQGLSLFTEEDDDDEGEGEEEAVQWYKRSRVWFHIAAFTLSALLLMVGILTHNVESMKAVNNSGVQLFRWMYFFAAWPALWMVVSFMMDKLFAFIEWWFYREALFYLDSVRRTARGLIFMCLILPWFVVCFWEAWCGDSSCEAQSTYKQATDVVWKLMVCLTLFSLANFLKSVLTKLLSSHFYKTAHFMKVKAAIEKEYWLLMLSQPRPAPKPPSEPPLARLSHFVYNAPSNHYAQAQQQEETVVPRSLSDSGGSKLRRRNNKSGQTTGDLPPSKPGLLAGSVNFWSRKDSHQVPTRAVSCGTLGNGTSYAAGQQSHAEHELTLSRGAAAGLAHVATGAKYPSDANAMLSPDFTAKIVVSGFNIETGSAGSRGSPRLDRSPTSFSSAQAAAAGGAGFDSAHGQPAGSRVGSLTSQLQPGLGQQGVGQLGAGQHDSSSLEKARSSSLRWAHLEGQEAGAAAAAGVSSEVNLQPFRADADRLNMYSGSDAEVDEKGGQHGSRWGFWKRLGPHKEKPLLPDGHSPSSPASQHTLIIQDPGKPEGSSPSRQFGSGPSSVFASPTAQQQQHHHHRLGVSRLNSELSRKPGSGSVMQVKRRSTDMGGAAGSVTARAAAPAAGSAAAVTSDPLLAPGVLEAVNLRVDGKAVDTSTIKPAEWDRLRAGIALKTFTALMKRYQNLTDAEEAKKLRDARRFAKGLFYHVRGPCMRPYVVRDDFTPFFGSKESADAAFSYFDKDNDATLSLKEMKDSVAAIFKERKNMAASLKDTDSIVNTLEFGIGFLLHFIFAAIYLLVWGMDIVKGFSTFSATVLALTFVFGNSVRQIFESMLFLFVEHAFDVGDLLEVELITYRVKKIDLMYTVLVKSTGERCYFPNTRLITLPVVNLTRSCARSEKVVISLNVGQASNAAREALLAAVKEHYEENEGDFNSCPSVNFTNLVDPFKAQLGVTWTYNFSADETKRTSMVKTGLLQVIHSCLGSLPHLEYTLVRANGAGAGAGQLQGDSDSEDGTKDRPGQQQQQQQALGAGVAERQAANMATMGAAALGVGMLGGTAMMGTAGLAML